MFCNALARLTLPQNAVVLASELVRKKAVPEKAFTDAVHIAIASLHEVDLIASWNIRHIAGAIARRKIESVLADLGEFVPTIATPEEILEGAP